MGFQYADCPAAYNIRGEVYLNLWVNDPERIKMNPSITEEDIKRYIDSIKDDSKELDRFYVAIGVREKESPSPRVPSVFTIDGVSDGKTYTAEDEADFIDKIVYLCKKHSCYFYFRTSCLGAWIGSIYDRRSLRPTVEEYIESFFSSVKVSLNITGGLIIRNNGRHVYEVYGENEYTYNFEKFRTAMSKTPYIEGLSDDFQKDFIKRVLFSGYTKEQLKDYTSYQIYSEKESAFVEYINSVYEAPCCYPHEAKALAVLDGEDTTS